MKLRDGQDGQAPSKILRIIQNDHVSQQVCQALRQKYLMRLQSGFEAWIKYSKMKGLSRNGQANLGTKGALLKQILSDYLDRQQSGVASSFSRWKERTR